MLLLQIFRVKTQEGGKNDELIRVAKTCVENKMCVSSTHVATFHRDMEINYCALTKHLDHVQN